MPETTHTPGPWEADYDIFAHGRKQDWSVWLPLKGTMVADLRECEQYHRYVMNPGEIEANAHLIAAAPELLSALTAMAKLWHAYIGPDNYDGHAAKAYRDAQAAIAKAKGTNP